MTRPVEVEVKIRLTESEAGKLPELLRNLGAQELNEELHEDTYYDHPCESFSKTDEALRVRRHSSNTRGLRAGAGRSSGTELTYKGPKLDSTTKTRIESTVSVSSADDLDLVLRSLGFKPVATIKKKRIFHSLKNITLSIDDVDGVGLFMELEKVVADTNEVESARARIFGLVTELGFSRDRSVRESYLELYLARSGH